MLNSLRYLLVITILLFGCSRTPEDVLANEYADETLFQLKTQGVQFASSYDEYQARELLKSQFHNAILEGERK